MSGPEHFSNKVLRPVCILILINHNIAERVLQLGEYFRMGIKQLKRLDQQIVKIKRIVFLQFPGIKLVDFRCLLLIIVRSISMKLGRQNKTVFCSADKPLNGIERN